MTECRRCVRCEYPARTILSAQHASAHFCGVGIGTERRSPPGRSVDGLPGGAVQRPLALTGAAWSMSRSIAFSRRCDASATMTGRKASSVMAGSRAPACSSSSALISRARRRRDDDEMTNTETCGFGPKENHFIVCVPADARPPLCISYRKRLKRKGTT